MADEPPLELQVFFNHLFSVLGGKDLVCPVCTATEWEVTAIVASPIYTEAPDGTATTGTGAFPYVPLICKTCRHFFNFAWAPIKKAADGE